MKLEQFKIYKDWLLNKIFRLINKNKYSDGYIHKEPKGKDWLYSRLGSNIKKPILFPDKRPDKYRSDGEMQAKNNYETMSCTSQSYCNTIEEQLNRMNEISESPEIQKKLIEEMANTEEEIKEFKEIVKVFKYFGFFDIDGKCNIGKRALAKMSGTSWDGNSFDKVCECGRKQGLVAEIHYPWVDGWNNFYAPIPKSIEALAKKFNEYIDLPHEWVNSRDYEEIKVYGGLQSAIYAFPELRNGYYQLTWNKPNHGITNDYDINKICRGFFDSYDPFNKEGVWEFNIPYAKLITVKLKKPLNIGLNNDKIKELQNKGYKAIIRFDSHGEFYQLIDGELKHIQSQEEIKKVMKEYTSMDSDIIELLNKKILFPVTEDYFNKLYNIK